MHSALLKNFCQVTPQRNGRDGPGRVNHNVHDHYSVPSIVLCFFCIDYIPLAFCLLLGLIVAQTDSERDALNTLVSRVILREKAI
jgi:hypothetical protein